MIMSVNEQRMNRTGRAGFTLIELIIVVTIVAILALIAYPSYINSITRSKRAAATACLSSYATFMERFYTTNPRYAVDTAGDDLAFPTLYCAPAANTGADYGYQSGPAACRESVETDVKIHGVVVSLKKQKH